MHEDDVTFGVDVTTHHAGQEIERALMAMAVQNPNITMFEHHLATELVIEEVDGLKHCLGADILDQRNLALSRFVSPVTLLATGGAGQVSSLDLLPCREAFTV